MYRLNLSYSMSAPPYTTATYYSSLPLLLGFMLSKANHVLISAQTLSTVLLISLATLWQQNNTSIKTWLERICWEDALHWFLWSQIPAQHIIASPILTLLFSLMREIPWLLYIRNSNICKWSIDPYCVQTLFSHKALHLTEAFSCWVMLHLLFLIWHHVRLHLQDLAP